MKDRITRNSLTIIIVWLAFTSILMYKHYTTTYLRAVQLVPFLTESMYHAALFCMRGLELFNIAMLGAVMVWLLRRRNGLTAVICIASLLLLGFSYNPDMSGVTRSRLLAICIGSPISYMALSMYEPQELARQIRNAGWFIWFWCGAGLLVHAPFHLPHAGMMIAFRPYAAVTLFTLLLPWGLTIEHKRTRRIYLVLGAVVLCSMLWRQRIAILVVMALGAAIVGQRVRRWRWFVIGLMAVGIVISICIIAQWCIYSVGMRLELWAKSMGIIIANPTGLGLGKYQVYSQVETYHGWINKGLPAMLRNPVYAFSAHNNYITFAVETGIMGVGIGILVLVVLWQSRHYRLSAANWSLFGLAVLNLTGDTWGLWFVVPLVMGAIAATNWAAYWEKGLSRAWKTA